MVTGATTGLAQQQYTTLQLTIYPGTAEGGTLVYEDDGSRCGHVVWCDVMLTVDGQHGVPGGPVRLHQRHVRPHNDRLRRARGVKWLICGVPGTTQHCAAPGQLGMYVHTSYEYTYV